MVDYFAVKVWIWFAVFAPILSYMEVGSDPAAVGKKETIHERKREYISITANAAIFLL